MSVDSLESIAAAMVAPGKGILAADESSGTIKKRFDKIALESYQEQLDSANAAVALTTADDTKSFIAKLDEVKVAEVTADRMKEFREQDLPKFRDLIAGKPSKAEIMGRLTKVKNSFAVQFEVLKESVGIFTLLWLFLGVGSAFKLGAGTNVE